MNNIELFDAVRIVHLPGGRSEIPPYYSQTEASQIRIGDVGVVIGNWPNSKYRVEAVNLEGAIVWQDHFESSQLEIVPPTAAEFSRRRMNSHWAYQVELHEELVDDSTRTETLKFARKVMAFARRNVEILVDRLARSGYQFSCADGPWQPPELGVDNCMQELARRGVHVPIALQAWLMEVGNVDLSGTHPDWSRTGYSGLCDRTKGHQVPWYTDPLVIWLDTKYLLDWQQQAENRSHETRWLAIAPDIAHKANVSGGAPVMIRVDTPSFDALLIGQTGSFSLLSYLRWAFEWGGFPGFDYLPDAPMKMLRELRSGLTRL